MEDLSHETYLAEFAAREKIILEARRARDEAVHRFVVAPLARMIARLTARATVLIERTVRYLVIQRSRHSTPPAPSRHN